MRKPRVGSHNSEKCLVRTIQRSPFTQKWAAFIVGCPANYPARTIVQLSHTHPSKYKLNIYTNIYMTMINKQTSEKNAVCSLYLTWPDLWPSLLRSLHFVQLPATINILNSVTVSSKGGTSPEPFLIDIIGLICMICLDLRPGRECRQLLQDHFSPG